MPTHLSKKVAQHFDSSIKEYSLDDRLFRYEKIDNFLSNNISHGDFILEIGAGGGQYLSLLSKIGCKNLIAVDISKELLKEIKSGIMKVVADAGRLPFKDGSIDIVIAVSVLHHLISDSPRDSKNKAGGAAKEMIRITRNLILIDESPTVRHNIFTYLIFYTTLLISYWNLEIKHFNIRKGIIVNFMTPDDIINLFASLPALKMIKRRVIKRDTKKLPFLPKIIWRIMKWRDVFLVIHKDKLP